MDMQAKDIAAAVQGMDPREASKAIVVPAQYCVVCKQKKALVEEEFAVKERTLMGTVKQWDQTCCVCRDLELQKRDLAVRPGMQARLMAAMSRGQVPDIDEALKQWYIEFGGPKGMAKKSKRVFDKAMKAKEYKTAARILDLGMRMQIKVTTLRQQFAIKAVDQMGLDELNEFIGELEGKLEANLIEMAKSGDGTYAPDDTEDDEDG